MRRRLRTTVSALGALALAGSLTACGPATEDLDGEVPQGAATSDGAAATGDEADVAAEHAETDVVFVQQMIPHHEQAVMMSAVAAQRAGSDELRALAADIEAAQGPEIDLMRTMLETWGVDADGTSGPGMDGMDGMGMPGMMSEEHMGALGEADGAAFDRMWLQGMVEHHEGAIEMSRAQVQDGVNPQAVALAEQIAADQAAEIVVMEQMLADL